jgi:hypothetical protein
MGRSPVQRSPNECDREASTVRRSWPTAGCRAVSKMRCLTWKSEPFKMQPKFWRKNILKTCYLFIIYYVFWSKKRKNEGILNLELQNFGGVCRSRNTNSNSLHVAICANSEVKRQLEQHINYWQQQQEWLPPALSFPILCTPRDLYNKTPLLLQTSLKVCPSNKSALLSLVGGKWIFILHTYNVA